MTADRLIAGRYRLTDPIGTGAMGVVWRATDVRLQRAVAVKQVLLGPGLSGSAALEAKRRAMREGRIAARLHHPNAITVFDVAEEDGQPWLVMEYMDAPSLATKLAGNRTLPPIEVAEIGAQAASALAAAHDAGIMHRDVKPANLLVADDGTVKIRFRHIPRGRRRDGHGHRLPRRDAGLSVAGGGARRGSGTGFRRLRPRFDAVRGGAGHPALRRG
jgi:serine/threonine protein kinase